VRIENVDKTPKLILSINLGIFFDRAEGCWLTIVVDDLYFTRTGSIKKGIGLITE